MKEIKEKIVGQRVLSKEEAENQAEWDAVLSTGKEFNGTTGSIDYAVKESQWQQKLGENPQLKKDFERVSSQAVEVVRPRRIGNTWRLKPPYAEHALYVTIEAITVNGKKYPYEVFFHGKDISHRQWTDTLTLSLSEIFRKSIDYGFSLNNQLHNMQDTTAPEGGYRTYLKEGDSKPTYVKGLVSEIGYVLEEFVNECLASNSESSSNSVQELREFAKNHMLKDLLSSVNAVKPQEYMPQYKEPTKPLPPTSSVVFENGKISTIGERHKKGKQIGSRCAKCGEYAVVNQSGCSVCQECGDTKCE